MKRGLLILVLGILGAAIACGGVYLLGTANPRALMQSDQPELAWLRHEFNLGDAEFIRISQLHAGYLPQCKQRCQRINQLNATLSNTLATATQVTPAIERLLSELAEMRATCQAEMLNHFFEVSRTMPSGQGKRYLAWVIANTCLRETVMNHGLAGSAANAMPSHQP